MNKIKLKHATLITYFFILQKMTLVIIIVKAVDAGPTSAGPRFWPVMISAIFLFCIAAASAVLTCTCDLIPSNHLKCCVY